METYRLEKKMELIVSNVGKISQANIKIEGMTVIAGENNTGKSTIGKALFAFFNGLYQLDDAVINVRKENIYDALRLYVNEEYNVRNIWWRRSQERELEPIISCMAEKKEFSDDEFDNMLESIDELIENALNDNPSMVINRNIVISDSDKSGDNKNKFRSSIERALTICDEEIRNRILTSYFISEFDNQVNNVFTNEKTVVELQIKSNRFKVEIKENLVEEFDHIESLETQAVYIDDPFIVDEDPRSITWGRYPKDHRSILKAQLIKEKYDNIIDQIVVDKKIGNIFEKINTIVGGELVLSDRRSFAYQPLNAKDSINMKNISSGLKPFLIVKQLLQNGVLKENGMLILDEPEIHLHPEWQIVLAELIVLIQKEFGMHVLLTTHSPYFLYAIELFTGKHGMEDTSHYYLAKNHNNQLLFSDVSNNIDLIYKKLSDPFQRLENLSYE